MKTEPGQTVSNETAKQEEKRLKTEHEWRQILQQQLGELWLKLNFPESTEKELSQKKKLS